MDRKQDYSIHEGRPRKSHSEERLRAIKKKGLIDKSPQKPSKHQTERLLTLRYSTVKKTVVAFNRLKPKGSDLFKTSPISNEPNFQHLRHDPRKKRRLIIRSAQGRLHNVNPAAHPVTPVKLISQAPLRFQSPGMTKYKMGQSALFVQKEAIHPLQAVDLNQADKMDIAPAREPAHDEKTAPHFHVETVRLSYRQWDRPAGHGRPINNKKAQGGKTADELATIQLDAFQRGLVELGFATEDQMKHYAHDSLNFHYEHTHVFASHLGILRNLEKQIIDPRSPTSTVVGTEHLNTEMMLFEKFVDFLLYTNYHVHHVPYHEASLEYTCEYVLIPHTTQPAYLKLQITDYRTGKVFTQIWDEPYRVTEKPSTQMYTTLLLLLKAALMGKPLAGAPLQFDNLNKENPPSFRPK